MKSIGVGIRIKAAYSAAAEATDRMKTVLEVDCYTGLGMELELERAADELQFAYGTLNELNELLLELRQKEEDVG